eukprot:c2011_g1_i1.p1 GENE.c2011_g1_i1~~c2011_g1_i1.p1  ORF type:complete len:372 (-),score=74.65 c2011_g1_i1:30-1145(-)
MLATKHSRASVFLVRFSSSMPVSPTPHDSNTFYPKSQHPYHSSPFHRNPTLSRTYSHIPRHKAVVCDVPLLPLDGVVQFPRGPIRLRVSDASLNVMIAETASLPSSSRIVGVISQLSQTPEGDRDTVRKHIRLASKAPPAPFNPDHFFEKIQTMKAEDQEFALLEPNEVGLTGWRCADVGTLIRIDKITEVCTSSPPTNITELKRTAFRKHSPHSTKSTKQTVVLSATTLNRFAVRNYKRSLLGYWSADVELMREDWGFGGPKYANLLMSSIQQELHPHILRMCDPRFKAEVLTSSDPIHFSYVIPKIFPSFGISSLLSQAVLQCTTCTTRLTLEHHVIRHIAKVFGLPSVAPPPPPPPPVLFHSSQHQPR